MVDKSKFLEGTTGIKYQLEFIKSSNSEYYCTSCMSGMQLKGTFSPDFPGGISAAKLLDFSIKIYVVILKLCKLSELLNLINCTTYIWSNKTKI